MTIFIYIGMAAVLFLIGIIFILKGIPSEGEKAVPISNPEEIQELKAALVSSKTNETEEASEKPFMSENHLLRKEIMDEKEKYEQMEQRIKLLREEYDQLKGQNEKTIQGLKEENDKLKSEKVSLSSNERLLDELKMKTELLERQYHESQKQQQDMRAAVEQLKAEKDQLLEQKNRVEEKKAEEFKSNTAQMAKSEFEMLSNKLVETIAAVEDLKRENKDLQQVNIDLKNEHEKIKELNAHLIKKEKMMQYELTKNRAQALGLERICADFRTQIETMAGTASPGK